MFTAVLSGKIWKQPKCPSTEEWTNNMCVHACIYVHTHTHIHTHGGLLVIKKNEIMPLPATWTDLEIIILNEVSQIRHIPYITDMQNLSF